jgi:hypothetical protein
LLVQAAAKVAERIRKDMPPPALLRFFPESPLRPADSFMSKENEGMSEVRGTNQNVEASIQDPYLSFHFGRVTFAKGYVKAKTCEKKPQEPAILPVRCIRAKQPSKYF